MTSRLLPMRFAAALAVLVSLTVTACGDSPTSPSQNVPFTQTDLVVGSGATAANGDLVNVAYSLWLYDSGRPDNKGNHIETGVYPFTLGTGNAIEGWHRGIPGMRVGGRRRLIIPPDLAYGSQGSGPIPPNAALVFDVELLGIG